MANSPVPLSTWPEATNPGGFFQSSAKPMNGTLETCQTTLVVPGALFKLKENQRFLSPSRSMKHAFGLAE
jgi:hypothetical protein